MKTSFQFRLRTIFVVLIVTSALVAIYQSRRERVIAREHARVTPFHWDRYTDKRLESLLGDGNRVLVIYYPRVPNPYSSIDNEDFRLAIHDSKLFVLQGDCDRLSGTQETRDARARLNYSDWKYFGAIYSPDKPTRFVDFLPGKGFDENGINSLRNP